MNINTQIPISAFSKMDRIQSSFFLLWKFVVTLLFIINIESTTASDEEGKSLLKFISNFERYKYLVQSMNM